MNLSKKILRAINEGVLNALSFDDEDFDTDDMQLQKVTALYDIDRHNKMAQKIYYLDKFEELIPDPTAITKETINQAIEWHELHGALFNPHLDGKEFKGFIRKCIEVGGYDANLNWIDTSEVTDMHSLFIYSSFNGDISNWDVSSVTNMCGMFIESEFNGDISNWDVSSVTDMSLVFRESKFNGDISKWDVSSVTDMHHIFYESKFNKDISNWDVSNVTVMYGAFTRSKFNKDISNWDVSSVTDMCWLFYESKFNHDISNWDVSNVKDLSYIFDGCPIKKEYKPKFK